MQADGTRSQGAGLVGLGVRIEPANTQHVFVVQRHRVHPVPVPLQRAYELSRLFIPYLRRVS